MPKHGVRSGLRSQLECKIAGPQRDELEMRCRALLDELGPGWFITITPEKTGAWAVAMSVLLQDGRHMSRAAHSSPIAGAAERSLRKLVEYIRKVSAARMGMVPVRPLDEAVALDLHAWVKAHGGSVGEDGWVWLPDEGDWPAFNRRAEELGVQFAVDVR